MAEKGNQTKQWILKQARMLFENKGFKLVTMQDICEATGLSRGGLYRHYGNTASIFSDMIAEFLKEQNELFSKGMQEGLPAPVLLKSIFHTYKEEMLDSTGSLSIAIFEYFSSTDNKSEENALLKQYQRSYASWEAFLQYGMKRKEFKQIEPRAFFDLLLFSYQGVRMYHQLMEIPEDTPDHILSTLSSLLLEKGDHQHE